LRAMPVPGANGEMDVIRVKPLKGLQKLQNAHLEERSCNLCNDVTSLTIKRALHSTSD
jgi:hypothetical protein